VLLGQHTGRRGGAGTRSPFRPCPSIPAVPTNLAAPGLGRNSFKVVISKPTPEWNSGWDLRHHLVGERIDTNSRLKDREPLPDPPCFDWEGNYLRGPYTPHIEAADVYQPLPAGAHSARSKLAPEHATNHSNWNATSVEPETCAEGAAANLMFGGWPRIDCQVPREEHDPESVW
jgi:hypothetical protein